ncbi:hypothetical protein BpHYR1_046379 [Brachionus plicatilis]|uniref:Uncharacterized protein n=1 Tax=Brachionus plicatilis TaxID=10195 RepID=A0A3M7PQC9_BRAPC|nr:hypothetical protein BpHYR1_046379 [Brachionus plicatilis]
MVANFHDPSALLEPAYVRQPERLHFGHYAIMVNVKAQRATVLFLNTQLDCLAALVYRSDLVLSLKLTHSPRSKYRIKIVQPITALHPIENNTHFCCTSTTTILCLDTPRMQQFLIKY